MTKMVNQQYISLIDNPKHQDKSNLNKRRAQYQQKDHVCNELHTK
eukprot:CAMPEP_0197317448 /NCGR_PEP_ID=MMETSP0891-20130614/47108_1 /TAXON_ID=44058 ORGANISM="Aureoumbra lagunensis, Strain CCMP1510" /NCGR_SAMPLE_ID=MMETSP0891 /ASSEMBLY_ACC=CAM_ASM_000534 /LENGTH=44 /DNA_ID= /DNA_START= /DNA_END= /DNA_ORIENTATION=